MPVLCRYCAALSGAETLAAVILVTLFLLYIPLIINPCFFDYLSFVLAL